jgi:hypothetical protein
MPQVGSEPMTPVFVGANTFHALDLVTTVVGRIHATSNIHAAFLVHAARRVHSH